MKDVAGKELREGQTVAYAGQGREGKAASLRLATVSGRFTPKMVEIETVTSYGRFTALKSPGALAIVAEPKAPQAAYAMEMPNPHPPHDGVYIEALTMDNPNVTMNDADAFNEASYRAAKAGALSWKLLKNGTVIYAKEA